MEADHAIAGFKFRDAAADLDHGASKLVPQNLRRRDEAVMNLFDVRATDPAGGHAEKKFALTNFRNRHRLNRSHGLCRDRRPRAFFRQPDAGLFRCEELSDSIGLIVKLIQLLKRSCS